MRQIFAAIKSITFLRELPSKQPTQDIICNQTRHCDQHMEHGASIELEATPKHPETSAQSQEFTQSKTTYKAQNSTVPTAAKDKRGFPLMVNNSNYSTIIF